MIECDRKDDHVHLLVNYPPKVSVAKLVNGLKGISSRMIRKNHYDKIKHYVEQQNTPSQFPIDCALHPRPEGRGFTARSIKSIYAASADRGGANLKISSSSISLCCIFI